MFKDLKKFCTLETLLPMVGFIVLVVVLYQYSNGKLTLFDNMAPLDATGPSEGSTVTSDVNAKPSSAHGDTYASANGLSTSGVSATNNCNNKEVMDPSELLPKDNNNSWAQLNPTGVADFKNVNLLTAGHHSGINTVGSSLRNANMQLRSDPPNPQMNTGPWNNTTIEPDQMRRPLELGVNSS